VTIAVDAFPQRDVYNHHHFVPSAMVVEIIPLHAGPLPVEYDE